MAKEYSTDFNLKSAIIYKVGSDKSYDITDLITRFDYFESINYPAVSANLNVVDSGKNLIASLPIQGFEKVEIELEDALDEIYNYTLYVYSISNRFASDRFQRYTLSLISLEALLNEGVRISKTLRGKPEEIVKELLQQNLKTNKEIFTDPSLYNIVMNPGKKSPFAVINTFKDKTVLSGTNSTNTAKKSSPGILPSVDVASATGKTDKADYTKGKGTAGYFFYENSEGYHFKSIDTLCSVGTFGGTEPVARYVQENNDVGGPPTRKIMDIDFTNEINIMDKLRMGAYSSLICFYDFSTGDYEEQVYSLAENYDKMGHLGTQTGLPFGQKELSQYPTRIMSSLLDHETWFNQATIASPEEKHGATGTTTSYPDFQKYYISQSISRANTLENQRVKITVSGNPALKVGDKIEIEIPNQIPTSYRTDKPYDEEHSGVYLIAEINHAFAAKDKKSNTFLTLIRDSYGKRGTASKVE